MEICKTEKRLGNGTYKMAFSAKKCDDNKSFYEWTSTEDPNKLCIVEFKNEIRWANPLTTSDESIAEYTEFKKKLKSDPIFDYGVYKFVSERREDVINKYGSYFASTKYINIAEDVQSIELMEKWYRSSNDQFEIINELKKMHELNKIGITTIHSGAGAPPNETTPLAPMLYQIRIDTLEPDNKLGIPFSPDNMDSEFFKVMNGSLIKISYLVEKCGMSIIKFVEKDKYFKIGKKIIEFIDAYVDLTNELNCDFKPDNLCPQYNSDNEIESLSLLDIDAKFYIKDDDVNFRKHAKVFMKFMIFSYFRKYNHELFPDWGILPANVINMLKFFYSNTYMTYRYNPINMLWNYFDGMNPTNNAVEDDYEFMYYDELKRKFPSEEKLIQGFRYSILQIPKKSLGGSKKITRRYKRKRSVSRKYKKKLLFLAK